MGCNIFPPLNNICEVKKKCYPENVTMTDHLVSVLLQYLLDHTTKRPVDKEVIE